MTNDGSINKRISKFALIGMIILPFGLFLAFLFIPVSARTSPASSSIWQNILSFTLLPLSVISPFASTILGILGIADIRKSREKIYGMPLAVFVSLFYPIIILDILLIVIGWLVFGEIEGWEIIPLVWFTLILVIDYFIVRFVWRAATRIR